MQLLEKGCRVTLSAYLRISPSPVSTPSSTGTEREALRKVGSVQLRLLRNKFLASATVEGKKGKPQTGVRWWFKFCSALGVSPVRSVDDASPRAEKLLEENLLMDFVTWLVACRPSGKLIQPKTAMKYVSHVQGWASRLPFGGGRVGGGIELARLRGLADGTRAR